MNEPLDAARAMLRKADFFPRFRPTSEGTLLAEAGLDAEVELFIVARGGQRRAFLPRELAYPHVAQGSLAGEPYLVSF